MVGVHVRTLPDDFPAGLNLAVLNRVWEDGRHVVYESAQRPRAS